MSKSLWSIRLALAGAIALTGGACVLGDLFGADEIEQVELRLQGGQNINVAANGTKEFTVTLQVGDAPMRDVPIILTISNPLVATFRDGGSVLVGASAVEDSVRGRAAGCTTLEARFENSMLGGDAITASWGIRVGTGGCPP